MPSRFKADFIEFLLNCFTRKSRMQDAWRVYISSINVTQEAFVLICVVIQGRAPPNRAGHLALTHMSCQEKACTRHARKWAWFSISLKKKKYYEITGGCLPLKISSQWKLGMEKYSQDFLGVQWVRRCLPMQRVQLQSLVRELNPTCFVAKRKHTHKTKVVL